MRLNGWSRTTFLLPSNAKNDWLNLGKVLMTKSVLTNIFRVHSDKGVGMSLGSLFTTDLSLVTRLGRVSASKPGEKWKKKKAWETVSGCPTGCQGVHSFPELQTQVLLARMNCDRKSWQIGSPAFSGGVSTATASLLAVVQRSNMCSFCPFQGKVWRPK